MRSGLPGGRLRVVHAHPAEGVAHVVGGGLPSPDDQEVSLETSLETSRLLTYYCTSKTTIIVNIGTPPKTNDPILETSTCKDTFGCWEATLGLRGFCGVSESGSARSLHGKDDMLLGVYTAA